MNVEWVSDHFLGENFERRGGALPNLDRMRTFLRYVGDPGFQSGVAEDVGIDRTTVTKTISDVMAAILLKKNVWIKFPSTREEMEQQKANWQEKYRFPSAIGAVDCTQIPIRKPSDHGDEYINRKRFPSINVQATYNFAEEFTSVDASWPGSVHDARIWRNSDIYRIMEFNQANALLIGDSGYGIAPWLMTPYENPITARERAYNPCLAQERVIIERCFGQLKQRFPIMQNKIRIKTENVPSMVVCCFILHNVAKRLSDEDFDFNIEERQNSEVGNVENRNERDIRNRGQQRRTEIARLIHGA
ncbi:putative nuclease HARBI1 [Homalodisca vitripennis]|uniref:putative nuclease HARBI1 n=1 Tax=Homalodisca vitripennis TaxID=197043 RepID=UPI001EEB84DD|nr:putative nuclease HARBI1 [Homalodisca vitripennis]